MRIKPLLIAGIAISTFGQSAFADHDHQHPKGHGVIHEREQTVVWGNTGSAGGAQLQPGYIHVLHKSKSHTPKDELSELKNGQIEVGSNSSDQKALQDEIEKAMAVVASADHESGNKTENEKNGGDTQDLSSGQGYSIYEMQRWDRFCDEGGKHMDHLDKAFVKKHGGIKGVPSTLTDKCDPPSM